MLLVTLVTFAIIKNESLNVALRSAKRNVLLQRQLNQTWIDRFNFVKRSVQHSDSLETEFLDSLRPHEAVVNELGPVLIPLEIKFNRRYMYADIEWQC